MLFNSFEFIFFFLPITLLGFYLFGNRGHHRVAIAWLVGASLFFYGWWNPAYLVLILVSISFNYLMGVLLGIGHGRNKRIILVVAVATNLAVLGYYKYANFFIGNFNILFGDSLVFEQVILPLAISFFTFQQITYLIDSSQGKTHEYNFLHYCLFVTFFPQLIAGPIVHHKEMLPQFMRNSVYKLRVNNIAIGITIFVLGVFKKVVLADSIAEYSTPVFDAAENDVLITFFEAWEGAFAYTFQLYFDFSGYSDMAIGLARMFGVRLPLNFNSPYKATSIIDFWRRWHITLSRFLRDYIYIPLGGSRKGEGRRHLNLMITMLLGGLWHGAGWTFILWGGLHGFYLIINHVWRKIVNNKKLPVVVAWFVTFIAVVIAWVPFRAESIDGANNMLAAMIGVHGISISPNLIGKIGDIEYWLLEMGVVFNGVFTSSAFEGHGTGKNIILNLFIISIAFPNTQQVMYGFRPSIETYKNEVLRLHYRWLEWKPTLFWSFFIAILFVVSILSMSQLSEFLYFQF